MLHGERTAEDKAAACPSGTIAVAKLCVDSDHGACLRLEAGKVGPWQLELNLGSLGYFSCPYNHANLWNLIEKLWPQTKARRDLVFCIASPVAVNGAERTVRPSGGTEIIVLPRVKIPLHRIAFPKVVVVCVVGLSLIKRTEASIEGFVVPHVEKLRRTVFEIGIKILYRCGKGLPKLGKVAVDFHLRNRASCHTAHAGRKWLRPHATGAKG